MNKIVSVFAVLAALGSCREVVVPSGSEIIPQQQIEASSARDIHDRIMVLDGHLDTPAYFHSSGYDISDRGSWEVDRTSVDLPRMEEGGLDGGFWVIYTPQGPLTGIAYEAARNAAILRQISIREVAAKHHERMSLAFTADEAERVVKDGKVVVLQSMENAYPLGEDLSLLDTFYLGGLRMVSPVHFSNNQFADSATDTEERHGGLSSLGRELVVRANQLGMVLDASHASDAATRDMMALSQTPIILSHTGPRAIFDHPRNIPDQLLVNLARSGGVIQINAHPAYLEPRSAAPGRDEAVAALREAFGTNLSALSAQRRAEWRAAYDEIDREFPQSRSSYETFRDHLLYTLELIGPDHVGISADWDGGGGVDGMQDVAVLPRITEDLSDAGYSEEDIAKVWGGNMMRLLRAAEAARSSELVSPATVN